jgi:hypothetical protein
MFAARTNRPQLGGPFMAGFPTLVTIVSSSIYRWDRPFTSKKTHIQIMSAFQIFRLSDIDPRCVTESDWPSARPWSTPQCLTIAAAPAVETSNGPQMYMKRQGLYRG